MARRSLLFSPGDRPEMLRKAAETEADVLCFDLEDAVLPEGREAAREAVRSVLADPDFDPDAEVCLRVGDNPTADVTAVVDDDVRLDAVMVPKVETVADVEGVSGIMLNSGRPAPVFALVETARGVLNAEAIAATESTRLIAFGAEDLSADIGASPSADRSEVSYARQHVVLAARAAGVDVVDAVYRDTDDEAGLRADARTARDLGYDGKMAIHPDQVRVINEAFTPDPEQVEWAKRVLEARDQAENGVFEVDGEMVDAPVITRAERVVERANAGDE